jgi:Na+-transporting NADH:ubiquinone oxidoreductase subunit C
MSKESAMRKRIFTVVFMLVVTIVFISITTVVFTFTKDTIALNERLSLKEAVLYSSGLPLPEDPVQRERLFDENVTEVQREDGSVRYFEVREMDSPEVKSYVIIYTGAGLWGEITCAIGFERDLETFVGLEILDQNETPGLGGRIGETWFKEQFRGKSPPLTTVAEGYETAQNQFQAITGATYSTAAIRDIMNSAQEYAIMEISEQ